MTLQIIITIFILFAVYRIAQNYRTRRFSLRASIFWCAVWIAVGVVFWIPDTASRLALIFGIGRGADLIVYSSIIVLVYLVYRLFVRIEHLDRTVTTLTRAISLHDAKRQQHDDSHTDS